MNYTESFNPGMYDGDIDINITNKNYNDNTNMNMNKNMNTMGGCCGGKMNMMADPVMGSMSCPIVEPMKERVIYKNIYHTVPHVCPINTKVINNHIYRHTYEPRYTCCEENVVSNEQCGSCCDFN